MKTIIMENGQIIENYESIKEIKSYIMDGYINNKEYLTDDSTLYIEYKDGSTYYLSGTYEEGIFKKTNIKTVVESNPCTYSVFGDYKIVKTDDEDDDINCCWIIQ